MSYLDIQILLVPVLFAAVIGVTHRRDFNVAYWWCGIVVLAVIATVWTTPWDNWMVASGVWGYPENAVLGTIGHIPAEEQAFFVIQTVLTGSFLGMFIGPQTVAGRRRQWLRVVATGFGMSMVLTGLALLACGYDYMGSMLMWFGIPLTIQLAWGADQLAGHVRTMVPAILLPTAALCLVDSLAVREGTWFFDRGTLTGIQVGGLPLEEVIFFGITNTLIVVGLTLWHELHGTLQRLVRKASFREQSPQAL